ncbi:energy-coupling factor transporter transmembrane component T family protein [Lacibacterium aquatile]|uniref:Energy-coupling factor transporter transmembrane component T family protein n=1 Tax=Lacibacterium aquatile TaxID=1168082 RepID=A0ABW5DSR9_9PROT
MLAKRHAGAKLALALLWLVGATWVASWQGQAILLGTLVGAALVLERVTPWKLLKTLVPFALFGVGFLWTHALFGNEAVGGDLYSGVTPFLRTLVFGLTSFLFVRATPPSKLVRCLIDWGLSPRVGFAVSAVYQLLPGLTEDMRSLRLALRLRGGMGFFAREGAVLLGLLALTIRKSARLSVAMAARGLDNTPRSWLVEQRWRLADSLTLAVGIIPLITIFARLL